ncbi:MAG: hybrid sensor histidine kinase/response regulator [Proteobacteria bacterium]|nr:MAG: hybrid sensor histidine kinase/response regulator [Pseudomonadota bacterium]
MDPLTQATPEMLGARKCLLVDDLKGNLLALESLLRPEGAIIFRAQSGEEALELLLEHDFALALVDVQMPGMNGFELAEYMRGTEKTRHIPIIFVTAGSRVQEGVFQGYEAGAVDFLFKPLDPFIVRSKVRIFLELDQQRAKLMQTERELTRALAARDEFFSIASHELKTPITAINLQLQILGRLLGQTDPGNPVKERMEKAFGTFNRQVTKLNGLVDTLLDVTRIKNGKLSLERKDVDLSSLVKEVVDRFTTTDKTIEIRTDITPGVRGSWDLQRLDQVAVNLVSNAVKYGNGSRVDVTLRREEGFAKLTVKDGGSGISPDRLPYIFDRFERAVENSSVQGLGLGLYIVKQIVQAHGGSVNVESRENEGTTFVVTLPAVATPATGAES